MPRITLHTLCYMQLVQRVFAYIWYGAPRPSLGAPRTTYVSEAALCTLCGVRYVHSTLVCSAVAVLLFAPHVACAQRLDSLHKPHAVVCACLTLAHEHHTLRRCPVRSLHAKSGTTSATLHCSACRKVATSSRTLTSRGSGVSGAGPRRPPKLGGAAGAMRRSRLYSRALPRRSLTGAARRHTTKSGK